MTTIFIITLTAIATCIVGLIILKIALDLAEKYKNEKNRTFLGKKILKANNKILNSEYLKIIKQIFDLLPKGIRSHADNFKYHFKRAYKSYKRDWHGRIGTALYMHEMK